MAVHGIFHRTAPIAIYHFARGDMDGLTEQGTFVFSPSTYRTGKTHSNSLVCVSPPPAYVPGLKTSVCRPPYYTYASFKYLA
jgi:hypothetical protein